MKIFKKSGCRQSFVIFAFLFVPHFLTEAQNNPEKFGAKPLMMFGDTLRTGVPFSKDPHVVWFGDRYLMYYSVPPYKDKTNPVQGWGIGISESRDLQNWERAGEITPGGDYEKKGLAAPCALVIDNRVHLFYQTYGNGKNDAICHAWSDDGIRFIRDPSNPVFSPDGDWNCGRAIDAEVIRYRNKYLLCFATRDTDMKIQMLGMASAPLNTDFSHDQWTLRANFPVLKPELSWEGACVEGASLIVRNRRLYMFYAGAYNNSPQQIGVAVSSDGTAWRRLSDKPFLPNGAPGEWNSSESGHPHIFKDKNGKTWLYYQGNSDMGKSWFISRIRIKWNSRGPYRIKNE